MPHLNRVIPALTISGKNGMGSPYKPFPVETSIRILSFIKYLRPIWKIAPGMMVWRSPEKMSHLKEVKIIAPESKISTMIVT